MDLKGIDKWSGLKKVRITSKNNNLTITSGNANVDDLTISNITNTTISGISKFSNLKSFNLSSSENLYDISDMSTLTSLTYLTITGTQVSDLTAVGNLKNIDMKRYDSNGNVIANDNFNLSSNKIVDISPLLNMRIDTNSDGVVDRLNYSKLNISGNNLGGDLSNQNINTLKALCDSGLTYVNISNCGFTNTEVNEIQSYYSSKGAVAASTGQ